MAAPAPAPLLVAPTTPRPIAGHTPFSWAMFLAPLAIGLLMARLFSPLLALFALLSPVLLVASWFEQRRRRRRTARDGRRVFAGALAEFERAAEQAARTEAARRVAASPDIALLVNRAHGGDPRLWERRPDHDDFLELSVGHGSLRWSPSAVMPDAGSAPDVATIIERHGVLRFVPIPVALSAGHVVGIVGPPDATDAVARSLLTQAAVLHGPADLGIGAVASPDQSGRWAFLTWLPHALDPGEDVSTRVTDGDIDAAATAIATAAGGHDCVPTDRRPRWSGPRSTAPTGSMTHPRTWLTVVDNRDEALGHHVLMQVLPAGSADPRAAVVLTLDRRSLPATCTAIIEIHDSDGHVTLTRPREGSTITGVLATGVSPATAIGTARRLARFRDPELASTRRSLPGRVRWADLHPAAPTTTAPMTSAGIELSAGIEMSAGIELSTGIDGNEGTHGLLEGATALRCTLGLGADGPVTIDLVRDGPHALIGGTTGSGKSELLRVMIASLATNHDADAVNLVLIDYKGGSAFDACAQLPHTVGLVTDLDAGLGARALRALHAEVRHRERRLRIAGVGDLPGYAAARRTDPALAPLPRLVVVIDEFATLATDLPMFLDALVSVAQRGRSLGIHLVLATQRPHGAISEAIRTNTNIRIALRVLDPADSTDVLGDPAAAHLPRHRPGQGYVRLGPDDLTAFQAPLVSAAAHDTSTWGSPRSAGIERVDAFGRRVEPDDTAFMRGPWDHGSAPSPLTLLPAADDRHGPAAVTIGSPPPEATTSTELARVVRRATESWAATGRPDPRRPWLPPLPGDLPLTPLLDDPSATERARHHDRDQGDGHGPKPAAPLAPVVIGVADDPDRQRQDPWSWAPERGPLVVCGMPGSGTTTALITTAVALAARHRPEALHLFGLDFDHGGLDVVAALPHCGAVIGTDQPARRHRLLRHLDAELRHRRVLGPGAARAAIVVLIDGFAALRATHDDLAGLRVVEQLTRLALDGPALGIHVAIGAERPQVLPAAILAGTTERLVLRLADSYDYALCGVRVAPATRPHPGRAISGDGLEVQIAHAGSDGAHRLACTLAAAAADDDTGLDPDDRASRAGARAPAIDELPTTVAARSLTAAQIDRPGWSLPLGIGDLDLAERALVLHPGEHILVAGPPRSGRTTTLALAAFQAQQVGARVVLLTTTGTDHVGWAMAPDTTTSSTDVLATQVEAAAGRPLLVLIDDAETLDDPDGVLEQLLQRPPDHVRVIVAGRSDRLRSAYGHWTRHLRGQGLGLALRPDIDGDDIWGVRLPRYPHLTWPPGRGVLLGGGDADVVQVARP